MTMIWINFARARGGRSSDQLLAESGIREEQGTLVLDTTIEDLGRSVLTYGQAITRIYDLTFLNRAPVASTFYEDLNEMLYNIVDGSKITPDFVPPNEPNAQDYPIDYRIEGKEGGTCSFWVSPRGTKLVWPRSSWSIGCDTTLSLIRCSCFTINRKSRGAIWHAYPTRAARWSRHLMPSTISNASSPS